MLSIYALNNESYPVAIIKENTGNKKVHETIYYTEPSRSFNEQDKPFEEQISKYLSEKDSPLDGAYMINDDQYEFEMVPTVGNEKNPRFINYYLSASNSGKSYQIASLCKRYLQQFPDNIITYVSANPLENDKNYDSIRDQITTLNPLTLESIIDSSLAKYHNSLWIFDDCDSGFSVTMEDLDERLIPEEVAKLTVTDKVRAAKMLQRMCEMASVWVAKSIEAIMMVARKYNESLCVVGHKPFDGGFENKVVGEATGVILFPASIKKNILEKFIKEKLSFEKKDAEDLMKKLKWYRYDFLFISHRSSIPFIITNNLIKLYD